MAQALKVFINYRRDDSQDFVEKFFPWLYMRYGAENVFVDYSGIPEFERFEDFIRYKIRESDVVISIIGPKWLAEIEKRRGGKDFVLIELEEALQHRKIIAPICVNGAATPAADALPASIRPMFAANVGVLPNARAIPSTIQRLWARIEALVAQAGDQRVVQASADQLVRDNAAVEGMTAADAYGRLLIAYRREEWDVVLGWAAELAETGDQLPPEVQDEVAEIEAEVRRILAEAAEKARREQVAAYLYGFAQQRHAAGFVDQRLGRLLESVWAVAPGYDPDRIAQALRQAQPQAKPQAPAQKPAPSMPPPPRILPGPFEWCYVPGGEVTLEEDGYVPEGGQRFTVGPFYIAKYAITNAQFAVFVRAKDGYRNAGWWDYSKAAQQWREGRSRATKTAYRGATLPRTNVSWYDAMAFCRWLSAKTGEKITLPTEQQWQLAAIGTDGRAYPWGNQAPTEALARFGQGWEAGPVAVDALPVGASPFGALNMAGNVWEWCITGYETGDQVGNTTDTYRVLRGGSFLISMNFLRGSSRYRNNPDFEGNDFGFRCARSY